MVKTILVYISIVAPKGLAKFKLEPKLAEIWGMNSKPFTSQR
jgi:hypothetical protein